MDITFNRTNEGFIGIDVDSNNNYVYANRARLNAFFGIGTVVGEDNHFFQNDARYNANFVDIIGGGFDCFDETTGTGTEGTANTWEESLGLENQPQDICIPLAPDF